MRLFTTMLVALLSIVGASNLKAQVTVSYEDNATAANDITTGYYVIKAKYKTANPCYLYMTGNSGKFSAEVENASLKNIWLVEVNSDNSFYLKNVAEGKYLKFNKAATAADGSSLTASSDKSANNLFSASADYNVKDNITKLGDNSVLLYEGTPTTTENRQVVHADGNTIETFTISSWITSPHGTIGSGSAIGQFEFYKVNFSINGATPTVNNSSNLYSLVNANGQYLSGDVKNSSIAGATTSKYSSTDAYTFFVNRNEGRQDYYINVYNASGNQTLNTDNTYLWRMPYAAPTGNKEYWVIEPIAGQNAFTIKSVQNNKYLQATSNGAAVTFTTSVNSNSTWYFIPANESATAARDLTLRVKFGDYTHGNLATFSASYPVSLPEGYEAFTATHDAASNVINITKLEGNVIPANTGVLIKGDEGNPAMKPTLEAGPTVTNNKLMAVGDAAKTFTDDEKSGNNIYLLGRDNDNSFCFRIMNTEGTQTIAAHKAYILLDNATDAASLKINFGGEVTTGINQAATVNKANNTYYDLSGRRVTKPQHGLYIVNGKKVIIK